ncbi:MAG: hypothetical protein ACR2NX_13595 [Chthoniobacterales bacterium]
MKNLHLSRRLLILGFAVLTAVSASVTAADLSPDLTFRPPAVTQLAPAHRTLLLPDGRFFLYYQVNTATAPTGYRALARRWRHRLELLRG